MEKSKEAQLKEKIDIIMRDYTGASYGFSETEDRLFALFAEEKQRALKAVGI